MKKRIILLVLPMLMLAVGTAQAQGGLIIGANMSNLYIDNVDDENSKIGINVGLYNRWGAEEGIGLRTELLYSQKGAAAQYNNFLQGSGKYRFNLNYLKVPAMLSLKAGPLDIHAGPYIGILLGANVKDVDSDGNINQISELDRDDFNTTDYGAAVGLGLGFSGGHISLRYNYGMREIGKDGSFAGQATEDAKNSALTLSLGLGLN
ncbi:porin family protein [uncultured Roseivirga sp.]|uniref:porin family protein n=1 Tax=uncultured Roseivirga sp. TaxID=543088 RepID=UPI000D7A342D|nr:porin family protein [uncultured Roseivirga sp.]PWL29851.1 MAG: PorT family protein [Roseivirga sp. XM-24bin3]